jgi:hypothetical protein
VVVAKAVMREDPLLEFIIARDCQVILDVPNGLFCRRRHHVWDKGGKEIRVISSDAVRHAE